MVRRSSVAVVLSALLLSAFSSRGDEPAREPVRFDLMIRNGRIVDGTGNPWVRGDLGIIARKIVAIGNLSRATAVRVIDAKGNIVAPGFIDIHSHASWKYLVDARAANKVTQGITLEIEGEGYSVAPTTDEMIRRQRAQFDRHHVTPDWRTLAQFLRRLEQHPATINFATYLGTATVREMVIGLDDRPATPLELDRMCQITEEAMRDGALGVYSALMYSPDRYNRTEELVEMAKVAARFGGVYQTHPRSESDAFMESMNEVIRIAREARIPAHVTHLKMAYQQNWGKIPQLLGRIEDARASGLDVTADMYPYERAAGSFTALLPPWAQVGGRGEILRRLADPSTRERIKRELREPASDWENEYYGVGGGPAGITIVADGGNAALKPYVGKTLEAISAAAGKDPRDVLFDIISRGDAEMTVLIANEGDIRAAIQKSWMAFGTDGSVTAPDGPLSGGLVHPRSYGTFPRVFGTYVRDLGLIRLEEAVRRATSLPAHRLNIRDRGLLREGFFADIVVFDPDTIADTATYANPHEYAKGILFVVVNGRVVLDGGKITEERPGMVLRGPGYDSSRAH